MHLALGSRSERGGARRAPTKRVNLKIRTTVTYPTSRHQEDFLVCRFHKQGHLCHWPDLIHEIGAGEEEPTKLIETTLADLLKYLEANRSKLFTSKNYIEASDLYLKKADNTWKCLWGLESILSKDTSNVISWISNVSSVERFYDAFIHHLLWNLFPHCHSLEWILII